MQPDWTIIGVVVAVIAVIIAYMQLHRTPKPPDQPPSGSKYKRIEQRLTDARKAIEREDLLLFLMWKYKSEPILEKCGYIYPVAAYAAPKSQWESLETALKSPLIKQEPKLLIDSTEYWDLVNSLKPGKGLTHKKEVDTRTYAMKYLLQHEKLELECNLGHYSNSFLSCEVLEWEIRSKVRQLKGRSEKEFQNFYKQLPLRRKLHENVSNPVLDGTGRSPAVGVSVLIAFNDNGTIKLLTKRRSSKGVPLRAGLLHVIPGFMFQPTTHYVDEEYNVTHNIYREYLEELFNFPENFEKHRHPHHFYRDKRLVYLKTLLADGEAKLYFTGITVNLLNLRPEICTLLLIRTPEWYEKCKSDPELQWDLNDEFFNEHRFEDAGIVKEEELVGSIAFSHDDNEMLKALSLYPSRTVPAGAGAFWLGVDTLKDLLPENLNKHLV